jgi:hypothetical protein
MAPLIKLSVALDHAVIAVGRLVMKASAAPETVAA